VFLNEAIYLAAVLFRHAIEEQSKCVHFLAFDIDRAVRSDDDALAFEVFAIIVRRLTQFESDFDSGKFRKGFFAQAIGPVSADIARLAVFAVAAVVIAIMADIADGKTGITSWGSSSLSLPSSRFSYLYLSESEMFFFALVFLCLLFSGGIILISLPFWGNTSLWNLRFGLFFFCFCILILVQVHAIF